MTPAIDLRPDHRKIVEDILHEHLPAGVKVWVFGSRAEWTTKDSSDLDLALESDGPLDTRTMMALELAFEGSLLPFSVDVVDLLRVDDSFREAVDRSRVVLKERQTSDRHEAVSNDVDRKELELRCVAQIVMGQSPPGSTYNEHGVGLPFFQGVKDFTYRSPVPRVFCSAPSRVAQEGDLLLSVRAPIGRVNVADRECAIGRGLSIIRAKGGSDARYLEFVLRHLERSWQAVEGSGSVFGNATRRDLETLRVPWPAEPERRVIAHVLGTLDDRIELNRRTSERLDGMARALFKSWFVDFDPVRAKMEGRDTGLPLEIADLFPDRFVASDSGRVPDGWKVSEIGQEVLALGGTTPSTKRSDYWDGGKHFWATPKDLSRLSSPVLLGTDRKITDAGLARIGSGLLPVGTVLLSSRAPVGYLAIAQVPTAVNQGFIAMICSKRLSNLYVLFWCSERIEYIQGISGGSTFAEISKKVFRPIPVTVPSEQVIGAFDRLVRPLYARVVANMKQSTVLSQVRDVLLPRLVSGAVRLPSVLVDHYAGSDLQVAS
ncbi:MAG: hypothetical protein F4Z65_01840 [Acidobacteria bacterium]|nr:hypothetical protein [Acidobacteriota bacterium]MYA44774.1 hypothetical protein [Acidobacteriota bacterium]MYI40082.1 hypothetical protein [Acidobacteriota bacterium]